MLEAVKALTFDVFGTVVDWRGTIIQEGEALNGTKGLSVDWGVFADTWRGLYQPMLSKVRDGEMAWTKLDALHRMALDSLIDRFGLDGLTEAERQHLNLVWHRLDPWPDVLPGLERLRRRYILAPLSNGHVRLIVDMAKRAGLLWDAVLGAELARTYKPKPAVYLTGAALLDLQPSECMMVAAHYGDHLAARACGFRTCYVRRDREYGPRPKDDLPADHGLDLIVMDFNELATALGV